MLKLKCVTNMLCRLKKILTTKIAELWNQRNKEAV